MSTFSPNLNYEEVARNGDVGTWDTPTNSNWSISDSALGAIATISLNNTNVVLSAAQFQSKTITFNSTLTGSVTITFPTSFTKSYEIQHLCTGSSAFTITLETTATGGHVICAPPGEIIEVVNDGTNLIFKNMDRIGSYFDYAGSSLPAWISGCSIQPYLNCDGTSFSSVTYPALATVLGGTTLPDARGHFRLTLNQGTGRVTTGNGGMDGNTLFAQGGIPNLTLVTANLPPYTPAGTIAGTIPYQNGLFLNGNGLNVLTPGGTTSITASFTGTPQGGGSNPLLIVNPAFTGGLTLIRAA